MVGFDFLAIENPCLYLVQMYLTNLQMDKDVLFVVKILQLLWDIQLPWICLEKCYKDESNYCCIQPHVMHNHFQRLQLYSVEHHIDFCLYNGYNSTNKVRRWSTKKLGSLGVQEFDTIKATPNTSFISVYYQSS